VAASPAGQVYGGPRNEFFHSFHDQCRGLRFLPTVTGPILFLPAGYIHCPIMPAREGIFSDPTISRLRIRLVE